MSDSIIDALLFGQKRAVAKAAGSVSSERLYGEARELGLISEMVKDAGRTEIPAGTITLLGIGPGPRRVIDELTGTLPLVK